jgi:hypothetical protein
MMRRLSGAFLAALLVALAAAPLFSKPPDLPQDPKIIVGPQIAPDGSTFIPAPGFLEGEGLLPSCETGGPVDPKTITESLHEMWITSLFLDVDPFLAVWTADAAPVSEPAKPEASQPESVCPYVRQQSAAKPVRLIANPEAFRSVMDNLRALEQAGELIKTARQLAGEGNWEEAKECLEKARVLCPGSSCEKQIDEVYQEIISATFDVGLLLIDTLFSCVTGGMHLINIYDADPNRRILELLNNSEGQHQIEYEWKRIWFTDQPPHLTPERVQGGIESEGEEPQEPEGCGCCCGCMFQFGMCWMSQLADWCKEQEANSPKSDESDADSQASGSACPRCEILHAKYVKEHGIEEQVTGLMKACYLAIGDERFEKAVDLARQAYALDPVRVQGDPIIYKMHLLAEQLITSPGISHQSPPAWRPNP